MKFRSILVASAAALVWSIGVQAQPINGPYVALASGVNFMPKGSATYAYGSNSPVLAVLRPSPGLTMDPGYIVLGSIGYGFGNGIRTEVEANFRSNQYQNASASVTKTSVMANVFYDFNNIFSFMTPYIGVGIGYAQVSQPGLTLISGTTTVATTNESQGTFAYQGIAGLAFPLASIPGLALTTEYRFNALVGKRNYNGVAVISTPEAVTINVQSKESSDNHSLLVGLRYAW